MEVVKRPYNYWPAIPDDVADNITIPPLKDDRYHVFVSHSSSDIEASRELRDILRDTFGLTCFHSEDDTIAGQNLVQIFNYAIEQSQRTLAIVTPSMQNSQWVEFEVRNARMKAQRKKELVFIPILLDMEPKDAPSYMKEHKYIEASKKGFWQDLLHKLTHTIELDVALPVGNLAHALAWSHYYGYLAIALPSIKERMMSSDYTKQGIQILPKMVMLFPKSCLCHSNISEIDHHIQRTGSIALTGARGGKPRNYASPVHKVTDPDTEEEFLTVLEYPTVLMTMYEMEMGRIADLDSGNKYHQMGLFMQKIKEIVDLSPECRNTSVLIEHDDTVEQPQNHLSRIIAQRIRTELAIKDHK